MYLEKQEIEFYDFIGLDISQFETLSLGQEFENYSTIE